jgi:transposase
MEKGKRGHMMQNERMAKRQFELNENEVKALRQREQQTNRVAELRRLQAVRLYGSGLAMAQIMDITSCAQSSIREWVQDYKREGLAGLAGHPASSAQNASKLSAAQRAELAQRLRSYGPQQVLAASRRSTPSPFWTVHDLRLALEDWYGVVYKDVSSYRQLLHECGLSYQRAEGVYKSRPNQAALLEFEGELEKSDRLAASAS